MDLKQTARERIESARDTLLELSHRINANPETAYQEVKACGWLADALEAAGFAVERGVADLPTAFRARAGTGELNVAVCAEYDSLPGIGHACGHNIIAAAAVGAGMGAAAVAGEIGVTVTVMGTPAEEGGGGKVLLLNRGAFDGVHAAMMVHPNPMDVLDGPVIASQRIDIEFHGKEAHASGFPQKGINAADAMTIAQVAIGLLRQHIRPSDRIHGIVTKGGDAPNVIPAHTAARYTIRARTLAQLEDVRDRVRRCFEAGAVATGCTLDFNPIPLVYAEMRHDADMAAAFKANGAALGRNFIEYTPRMDRYAGSTDMGNVSLVIPSIHPSIGINSWPAVNHQPEFAQYCATPDADRAVMDGAIAMAWTIIDMARDERLRARLLSSGGYRHGA